MMNTAIGFEAWKRYDRAAEIAHLARTEWIDAGKPVLTTHPNQAVPSARGPGVPGGRAGATRSSSRGYNVVPIWADLSRSQRT